MSGLAGLGAARFCFDSEDGGEGGAGAGVRSGEVESSSSEELDADEDALAPSSKGLSGGGECSAARASRAKSFLAGTAGRGLSTKEVDSPSLELDVRGRRGLAGSADEFELLSGVDSSSFPGEADDEDSVEPAAVALARPRRLRGRRRRYTGG